MPTFQERLRRINPFARRESRSRSELATYRMLTLASWAVAVAVSVYFTVRRPHSWRGHRIGDQNSRHRTAFSLNMTVVYVYWVALFVSQTGYIGHLFATSSGVAGGAATAEAVARVNAAVSVGGHFIANNVLHTLFVLLFVSVFAGHFWLAELVLMLNFINLSALYVRHPAAGHPRALVHTPTVAGPLAWTFVALYWNGAILVPYGGHLWARILANIFVWALLAYGLFHITAYRDYSMGFCLTVLAAALGVGQFLLHFIALQWIFAFIIMSLLFLATIIVAVPAWTNGRYGNSMLVFVSREDERAPLLQE